MRLFSTRWNSVFLVTLVLISGGYLCARLTPYPDFEAFLTRPISRRIVDTNGKILYISPLPGGMRREYLPLGDIPPGVCRTFRLVEDGRFYLHPGVDLLALARAGAQLAIHGEIVSGGSTITMQLARMVAGGRHEGKGLFGRKLREMANALRIEARVGKSEILELWLNNLPFGHMTEGVASAARRFFNHELNELSQPHIVALSLIPRSPSLYNPVTDPLVVAERVIELMANLGTPVADDGVRRSISEASWGVWPDPAPHFSRRVFDEAGDSAPDCTISTSLDLGLQKLVENRLQTHLDLWRESRMRNGAALLVENGTGRILAYVGSQDFHGDAAGQLDGVRVRNQPGSTIKPFLYAFAFENGFNPNDLLEDIPRDFGSGEVYVPRNFDQRFRGPVRLRTALASSLNVPATLLLERLGVREFTSFMLLAGFESLEHGLSAGYPGAGLGIALGNEPISLFELVRGFSVFAQEGALVDLTWRRDAIAAGGSKVIGADTAWMVFDILSDPPERVPGFGMSDPFSAGFEVAVKTGTSSRNQNIWALASTPAHTVGVWLGNFDGETVVGRTGSSIPARIALEVLSEITLPDSIKPRSTVPGTENDSLRELVICTLSGNAAGPDCPATRVEYVGHTADIDLCRYHTGSEVSTIYPPVYASWMEDFGKTGAVGASRVEAPRITSPADGALYYLDEGIPADMQAIRVEAMMPDHVTGALYINGVPVEALAPSSSGSRAVWIVPLVKGAWHIEVRGDGMTDERRIAVR